MNSITLSQKDIDRFWIKVSKIKQDSDCMEWEATKVRKYGQFWLKGTMRKAHRVSWTIHFGQIPEGLDVLHKCDNPSCVNPDHLFLGTHQDNMDDRGRKGRASGCKRYGEEHHNHILTCSQVAEIKTLAKTKKYSHQKIADMFGVSRRHIGNIISGKTRTNG